MIKKKGWIFTGIYFILGLIIGYFTSIRTELPENMHIIFDDLIPIIVLIFFVLFFLRLEKMRGETALDWELD